MEVGFVIGSLEIAKVLMTAFIMCYAYFFLRNIENYDEKRPWSALFIGALLLFCVQGARTLQLINPAWAGEAITDMIMFAEFSFLALLLFSFIYEHHLLVDKGVLLIEEKSLGRIKDSKNFWKAISDKYSVIEKTAEDAFKDDGPDPEEEMEKELEELDDDEELKKEEKDLDKVIK